MEEELPFGYSHRQKRSHAQMEGPDRSASPVWTFNSLENERSFQPLGFYDPPQPHSHDYEERHSPYHQAQQFHAVYEPTDPLQDPVAQQAAPSAQQPYAPGPHLPRVREMASSTPRRFAGDGLDYRRPAGSGREQDSESVDLTQEDQVDLSGPGEDDIIDLTADDSGYGASQDDNFGASGNSGEQQRSNRAQRWNQAPRLPRGMDIIIDLDNGEEEWRMAAPALEPASPEIEFISSRRLEPPIQPEAADDRSQDEDEVEFVRENALPEWESRRRRNQDLDSVMNLLGTMNGRFTHLRAQVDRFNAQINRTADNFRRAPVMPPRAPPQRAHGHVRIGFIAPAMDFEMIGFDMGNHGGARIPEPPPPTYQAPEEAPEGFTRSPEEKDVLVCPNCGDELCLGNDEVKKQVWIVKACGHVYCGECTTNRSVKRSAKGKERPANTKPFKECLVDHCGKNVSHRKSMIQIFL